MLFLLGYLVGVIGGFAFGVYITHSYYKDKMVIEQHSIEHLMNQRCLNCEIRSNFLKENL